VTTLLAVLTVLTVLFALIGTVASWTFVAIYSRPPFHWQTYEAGRHLMRFTAGIGVVLTWSLFVFCLRLEWPDIHPYPGPVWLDAMIVIGRTAIFGFIALMMCARLRILLVARENPPPEGDSRWIDDDTNEQRG